VTFFLIASAIKVFVVFNLIMVGVALLTLFERRVCAWMQDRLGPNRVGPQGILQPAADGLKNFLKEETSPAMADKALFTLAPIVSFVPALLTFGVIPFAAPLPTPWGLVPMVLADLPVGFLYNLAISSPSASGRSKGKRFVSAKALMKKITNAIVRGITNGSPRCCWATTCESVTFPANNRTATVLIPRAIS